MGYGNLRASAGLSSIAEVRSLAGQGSMTSENGVTYLQKDQKFKSGWRIYEIEIDDNESLEDVLKKNCSDFEFDQDLIEREAKIREEWQESTDRYIADLKKNGIQKTSLSRDQNEQHLESRSEHNRGMKF